MRAEGGPSCPSSKVVLFVLSTLHYVGADYSVTEKPPPLPPDATKTQMPPSSNSPLPCCIKSPLCIDGPSPPPKSGTRARFRGLWPFSCHHYCLHLSTTPHGLQPSKKSVLVSISGVVGFQNQPPSTTTEIEHSCSFSAVAGFLWLPPQGRPIDSPPQPPKSSICAHFRWLQAFSGCHDNNNPSTVPYNH